MTGREKVKKAAEAARPLSAPLPKVKSSAKTAMGFAPRRPAQRKG